MAFLSSKAIAVLKVEFCLEVDGDILVLIWHRAWNRVTGNPNGVTGWATVVRSWKSTIADGAIVRIAAHTALR